MVDPIGAKPVQAVGVRGITQLVAAPRLTGGRSSVAEPTVLRDLSSAPPVDVERVARIRKAVEEGRFPFSPATIADNLLALRFEWTANDQA